MQIDVTDRRLLRQLLADPALSNAALAERAGVTLADGERIEAGIVVAKSADVRQYGRRA